MLGTLIGSLAALAISSSTGQTASIPTSLSHVALVGQTNQDEAPTKRKPNSLGVKTSGQSAFVADIATGKVLYAKDSHRVMPIASLTKLVTAMVFLDQHPDFKQKIVIA